MCQNQHHLFLKRDEKVSLIKIWKNTVFFFFYLFLATTIWFRRTKNLDLLEAAVHCKTHFIYVFFAGGLKTQSCFKFIFCFKGFEVLAFPIWKFPQVIQKIPISGSTCDYNFCLKIYFKLAHQLRFCQHFQNSDVHKINFLSLKCCCSRKYAQN